MHKKLSKIQQELKAPKGQRNTFGNYNFRNCEDVLEAVKPLLGDLILTITDELVHFPCTEKKEVIVLTNSKGKEEEQLVGGDKFYIKATAKISDGEESIQASAYAREAENKKGMDDAQITGAASSYARKYALNGLFLIDDTKDPDSTNNHGKSDTPKYTAKPQPAATPQAAKQVFDDDDDKPWLDDATFDCKIVPWLADKPVATARDAMNELRKKYKVAKKWESMIEAELNK